MSEMYEKENKGNTIFSRRDFLRTAGLSAGALILAACGGAETEDATDTGGSDDSSSDDSGGSDEEPMEEMSEVVWWYGWGNLTPAIDTMVGLESFKEHVGNNSLTYRESVDDEEFLTAFAAGDPPDGGSNLDYPGFWARGVVIPADDLIAGSDVIDLSDSTEGFSEALRYNGELIGVPAIESFLQYALNYNSEHVEAAGLDPDNPPETWDELFEWHQALTIFDNAGNMDILGIDIFDAMAEEQDFHAFSFGHQWWDEAAQSFHLDDPALVAAFENGARFMKHAGADQVDGIKSVEGQGDWGGAVEAGVQSMIIEGYWHPGEASVNQPEIAAVNRASWAPVPESRRGTKIQALNSHYVQMYTDGKNIEGMFKTAEFLLTNEMLDIIFNQVGWLSNKLSHLETVDADAFPGLRFYIESASQADEWMMTRRSPIHWFVHGQWAELREQVYRDLMTAEDAAAELQQRAVNEWEAQGLG